MVNQPGGEHQAESEGPSSTECLQAYFDYFEEIKNINEGNGKQPNEIKANSTEDNHSEEPCNRRSIAKIFMTGMIGDQESLPYRDQVDVVAGFAEQETPTETEKVVALLDDRNSVGTDHVRRRRSRPNWGPLTAKQLREELSKQVRIISLPLANSNTPCSDSRLSLPKTRLHVAMMMEESTLREGFCKLYSIFDA